MTRRTRSLVVTLVLAVLAGSCSAGGGYTVTATFPAAVGLYERSAVEVMGQDVGTVERIELEDDAVHVQLRIDEDVPLPADVQATIMPRSVIGERTIVLYPPFTPQDDPVADGHRIPIERTRLPAEIDETLAAFNELGNSIDPDEVADFLSSSRGFLEGRGERINTILHDVATVSATFNEQDDKLVAIAGHLGDLAATLNGREQQLGRVIDAYSRTTGQLADERDQILGLIEQGNRLSVEGDALLAAIEGDLPADLERLALLAGVFETNVAGLEETVAALPDVVDLVTGAHRPEARSLHSRVNAGQPLANTVRGLLELIGVQVGGGA